MRSWRALLIVAASLLVSAGPPRSALECEHLGNEAFDDGRYSDALKHYEQAEKASQAPGRIAFNRGVALFNAGKYHEAERFFRCRLESDAPPGDKVRALYNLGTSLLHVADGTDAARLAEAISCFQRCLASGVADPALLADARHNLELAKVLWRRARLTDMPPPDRGAGEGASDRSADGKQEPGPGAEPGAAQTGRPAAGEQRRLPPLRPGEGTLPIPTADAPPPGAGQATSIPESEQLKPLSAPEARELLRQAEARIARERRALQLRPASQGRNFPDW